MHRPQRTDERPVKRPKVRLACQECRDRKIRCDGARPLCNSCAKKKLGPHCIYVETGSEREFQYVRDLENKVRELEALRSSGETNAEDLNRTSTSAARLAPHSTSEATALSIFYGPDSAIAERHEELQHHDGQDLYTAARPLDSRLSQLDSQIIPSPIPSPAISHVTRGHSLARDKSEPSRLRSPSEDLGHPDMTGSDNALPAASTMGATETTPTESARAVFLGRSSVAAFMKEVSQSSTQKRTYSDMGEAVSPSTSKTSLPPTRREREQLQSLMETLILPPRKVADTHLENYWNLVHPLVPTVHRPSFMKKYERVWNSDVTGDQACETHESIHTVRAFYATLNIILALGCTFAPGAGQNAKRNAETFYQRSQELITRDSYDHGSIPLVQALVLGAQYLESSDLINGCWVMIGVAIRVAQGIGVHLDMPTESQAEREERRRTWWYCVLMDRVHSMTLGRPPMVVWPSVVPFPSSVDDEKLSMEPCSSSRQIPHQELSATAAFVHALKLSDILMEVLKIFYAPPIEEREQTSLLGDFTQVQIIDDRLGRWIDGLPDHLRYKPGGMRTDYSTSLRQALILRCRFLHLQILFFRPTTVRLAQSRAFSADAYMQRTTLQRNMANACTTSCIEAAQELIVILHTESGTENLPPWWYSVFYLYTAGTVILAALLTPILRRASGRTADSLEGSWNQCLECLGHMRKSDHAFARQCLSMLQSARDQYANNTTDDHQSQPPPFSTGLTTTEPMVHSGVQNSQDFGGILNENAFLDTWWPTDGLDWLNSLPIDATET